MSWTLSLTKVFPTILCLFLQSENYLIVKSLMIKLQTSLTTKQLSNDNLIGIYENSNAHVSETITNTNFIDNQA